MSCLERVEILPDEQGVWANSAECWWRSSPSGMMMVGPAEGLYHLPDRAEPMAIAVLRLCMLQLILYCEGTSIPL